jgi:hypothetical protein
VIVIKKSIRWIGLGICLLSSGAHGASSIRSFQIVPNLLYTDDDVQVIFAVRLDPAEKDPPPSLSLVELGPDGEKIRFHWVLTDDGSEGDLQAHDGVYSRKIQFKESRPKKISFAVIAAAPETVRNGSEISPSISSEEKGVLEVRARPTFIEILKGIYEKIRHRS